MLGNQSSVAPRSNNERPTKRSKTPPENPLRRCPQGTRSKELKRRCKRLAKKCPEVAKKCADYITYHVSEIATGHPSDEDDEHCPPECCPTEGDRGELVRRLGASPFASDPDYVITVQAHHIFPVELFDDEMGIKLCAWNIGLNSAQNGVWLPSCHFEGRQAALHTGGPPDSYEGYVSALFRGVRTKARALAVIDGIRAHLLSDPDSLNKLSNTTAHCTER
jgi:hypothetical protein